MKKKMMNTSGINFENDFSGDIDAILNLRHGTRTPIDFRQEKIKEICGNFLDKIKKVLEIGCGCGRNAQFFNDEKYQTENIKYYGIDASPNSISYFYNNPYWTLKKETHYATTEIDDTILNNRYELIFSSYVLQHIGLTTVNKDAYTAIELTNKLLPLLENGGYFIAYELHQGQNNWSIDPWLSSCFNKNEYEKLYNKKTTLEGCDNSMHNLIIVRKK